MVNVSYSGIWIPRTLFWFWFMESLFWPFVSFYFVLHFVSFEDTVLLLSHWGFWLSYFFCVFSHFCQCLLIKFLTASINLTLDGDIIIKIWLLNEKGTSFCVTFLNIPSIYGVNSFSFTVFFFVIRYFLSLNSMPFINWILSAPKSMLFFSLCWYH